MPLRTQTKAVLSAIFRVICTDEETTKEVKRFADDALKIILALKSINDQDPSSSSDDDIYYRPSNPTSTTEGLAGLAKPLGKSTAKVENKGLSKSPLKTVHYANDLGNAPRIVRTPSKFATGLHVPSPSKETPTKSPTPAKKRKGATLQTPTKAKKTKFIEVQVTDDKDEE